MRLRAAISIWRKFKTASVTIVVGTTRLTTNFAGLAGQMGLKDSLGLGLGLCLGLGLGLDTRPPSGKCPGWAHENSLCRHRRRQKILRGRIATNVDVLAGQRGEA